MPRCKSVAVTLDHTAPAEVARLVLRGDVLEAHHPALEAALVGVDVLDVIAADGPLTLAGNERHLGDAGLGREHLIRPIAVGDEHGVLGHDGLEVRTDRFRTAVNEHRVGGLAMTVADDQNGIVLVGGKSWFLGLSAAFPGRPANTTSPVPYRIVSPATPYSRSRDASAIRRGHAGGRDPERAQCVTLGQEELGDGRNRP